MSGAPPKCEAGPPSPASTPNTIAEGNHTLDSQSVALARTSGQGHAFNTATAEGSAAFDAYILPRLAAEDEEIAYAQAHPDEAFETDWPLVAARLDRAERWQRFTQSPLARRNRNKARRRTSEKATGIARPPKAVTPESNRAATIASNRKLTRRMAELRSKLAHELTEAEYQDRLAWCLTSDERSELTSTRNWRAENLAWNREFFAKLERERPARLAQLAERDAALSDEEILRDIVSDWWTWARDDEHDADPREHFKAVINCALGLTRRLAHALDERGETEGDVAISFLQDGGLKNPRAVLVFDREWKRHLALPDAPTAETVVESLFVFYARLSRILQAGGIIKRETP